MNELDFLRAENERLRDQNSRLADALTDFADQVRFAVTEMRRARESLASAQIAADTARTELSDHLHVIAAEWRADLERLA